MSKLRLFFVLLFIGLLQLATLSFAGNQVTILYDAFGKPSALKKDWGYAALIEYEGKRILFDTGNNAEIFKHNVTTLGIDLKNLDFAVISHRHGDHTSGLNYLLSVNPTVTIYAPHEVSGFGAHVRPTTLEVINLHNYSLPKEWLYFDGTKQDTIAMGHPWPGAKFQPIEKMTEVQPGFFLISTVSNHVGTKEMRELSLAIRSSQGLILVVGCSHPGIEKIVQQAASIDRNLYTIFGGFHLLSDTVSVIKEITTSLHDRWKIKRMAPGHCTGLPAFSALRELYRENYDYTGLGTTISIPK